MNLPLIIRAMCEPALVADLDLFAWDALIRQARHADLTARLAALLEDNGALERVPRAPRQHLIAAAHLARRHSEAIRWEVNRVEHALATTGVPVVLLKGAAYLMADLPVARGRLFNDVDILVPKGALDETEGALYRHGWVTTHHDAYDQRYYREWMHELPPLINVQRRTVLDVHHTILPETAALKPDAAKLIAGARQLDGHPDLYVMAPTDMVLHSATHLFWDSEFDHGLRDLIDLDGLLRHFSEEEGFWAALVPRARELHLLRPLYYALRYCERLLGTPLPDAVRNELSGGAAATGGPNRGREAGVSHRAGPMFPALMDVMFERVLGTLHPHWRAPGAGLAAWLLFVRGHKLRMPWRLLLPHLLRKALRKDEDK